MKSNALLLAAGLALASPGYAQENNEAPDAVAVTADDERASDGLSDAEQAEAQAALSKMFDGMAQDLRADLEPVDPERLALAGPIASKVLPDGVMRDMMSKSFDMVSKMMETMAEGLPLSTIAAVGGLSMDEATSLDDATVGEVMAIVDPYYKQRSLQMFDRMTVVMGGIAAEMEPLMRTALGRAYAKRFTSDQLAAIGAFMDTPAGSAFAAESYRIYTDPEMMVATAEMMPKMMARLPELMAAVEKDALPPPRQIDDLSAEEKAKLADLLDVDVDDLSDPPTDEMMSEESDAI
ncbi:DUF2059 domain-containing protein [Novosphingopyxis iocasae]|uniref:DUF2059 domain-containing protein n=1 Tax=Novosphingopyxis iocasae TaxID=2762729 RepID=UPI0016511B58|nr:DUF2059 domain-containing protein [Novosphingopyxis iocasae]